jgi:hypothetical protein
MAVYKVFDASTPPLIAPPGAQAVLGYIGRAGQTPHIWTLPEWDRFARLRQFPAWVPSIGANPTGDAILATGLAMNLGWAPHQPNPRAIICDLETNIARDWYSLWAAQVIRDGFTPVAYGSLSTVLQNAALDVWAADWNDIPQLQPGQTIHGTQYVAGGAVDWSVVDSWLWDRGGEGPRHT